MTANSKKVFNINNKNFYLEVIGIEPVLYACKAYTLPN